MTSFFPDLNVWVALSVAAHSHSAEAWKWLALLSDDVRLIFCRYTQVGLLRLLTNEPVMGGQALALKAAWGVYDRWLGDPRVEFHPEPRGLEATFREATAPFAAKPASKWIGDCYLLSFSKQAGATLVTFDRALLQFASRHDYAAIRPA